MLKKCYRTLKCSIEFSHFNTFSSIAYTTTCYLLSISFNCSKLPGAHLLNLDSYAKFSILQLHSIISLFTIANNGHHAPRTKSKLPALQAPCQPSPPQPLPAPLSNHGAGTSRISFHNAQLPPPHRDPAGRTGVFLSPAHTQQHELHVPRTSHITMEQGCRDRC